jgi:hypothetical protein
VCEQLEEAKFNAQLDDVAELARAEFDPVTSVQRLHAASDALLSVLATIRDAEPVASVVPSEPQARHSRARRVIGAFAMPAFPSNSRTAGAPKTGTWHCQRWSFNRLNKSFQHWVS